MTKPKLKLDPVDSYDPYQARALRTDSEIAYEKEMNRQSEEHAAMRKIWEDNWLDDEKSS